MTRWPAGWPRTRNGWRPSATRSGPIHQHKPSALRVPTALLASVLCLGVLSACTSTPSPVHPKVQRFTKVPEAEKININLLRLAHHVRTKGRPLEAAAMAMGIGTSDRGVQLEIYVRRLDPSVVRKFQRPGLTVRHISLQFRRLSVVLHDLSLLYSLARIPEVQMILPEYGATTQLGMPQQLGVAGSGLTQPKGHIHG